MTQLRWSLAMLLGWCCLLFNLERLLEPIDIASFVYVLCGLMAIAIVTMPVMRSAELVRLVGASLLLFVLLKLALRYEILGASLPLTVTEAVAIVVTVALAQRIARQAHRFEHTAAEVAALRWQTRPQSFDEGQTDMYRELRRARRCSRPLSVIALEPTSTSLNLSVDRLIEEVRREMVERYVEARLADAVQSEIHDGDQVASFDGRLIVMLSESDHEHAHATMQRLAQRVRRELGIELRLGAASFPDDEVTLTGLVERAEAEMAVPMAEAPPPQLAVVGSQ